MAEVHNVRLSFEPFEKLMRDPEHSDKEFAAAIRRTKENLRRYRKNGVPFYKADKLAVDNGMHPSYIWGDAYWNPEKPHPYVVDITYRPGGKK